MIIESVAKYCEDNGIGTQGVNLFIGELPLDKTNIISINYSVASPDLALDLYTQTLDFWGRFSNVKPGYNKMFKVFDLLHKGQNYKIDDFHIYFSNALGIVDDMDRDSKRRSLYKVSIRFIFRKD